MRWDRGAWGLSAPNRETGGLQILREVVQLKVFLRARMLLHSQLGSNGCIGGSQERDS